MLNFRNTNFVFVALLIILLVFQIKYGVPVYAYLLLFLVYSLIVFYGCYNVGSGFFIQVICSADTDKKQIALSFDDGPAVNYTPLILNVLREQDTKAAFFCIGNRIAGNENILRRINDEGHIIGNHSYSHHFWFDMFSSTKMLNDMQMMDDATSAILGMKPRLFRPPYGVTNPNLKNAILKGNYIPVGWSVRSMDTVRKDEIQFLKTIIAGIRPGAVFLFHDTAEVTANVLCDFIKEVKKRGYEIVRLDKLLHLPPYA